MLHLRDPIVEGGKMAKDGEDWKAKRREYKIYVITIAVRV